MLLSEGPSWGPFVGSMINLAAISIERYLKVVHAAWAQRNLRKWTTYSAAAFAWIGGIVVAVAVTTPTTGVVNGVCYTLVFFPSHAAQTVYGIWYFTSFYVIILLIFIFCYGRIRSTASGRASETVRNCEWIMAGLLFDAWYKASRGVAAPQGPAFQTPSHHQTYL